MLAVTLMRFPIESSIPHTMKCYVCSSTMYRETVYKGSVEDVEYLCSECNAALSVENALRINGMWR